MDEAYYFCYKFDNAMRRRHTGQIRVIDSQLVTQLA